MPHSETLKSKGLQSGGSRGRSWYKNLLPFWMSLSEWSGAKVWRAWTANSPTISVKFSGGNGNLRIFSAEQPCHRGRDRSKGVLWGSETRFKRLAIHICTLGCM
eukprot:EG_transcript_28054